MSRSVCVIVLWCVSNAACVPRGNSQVSAAVPARTAPRASSHFASPYTYEWFIRAELLRANGQLAAAIEAYRAALAGADEEPVLAARLATALDEHGEHARALELLDEALPLDPNSEAVWLARAEILARGGAATKCPRPAISGTGAGGSCSDRLDEAIAAYEHAERAAPHSSRAPLSLAALLRVQASPERAEAVLLRFEARSLPGTAGAYQSRLARALASGDAERVFEASQPFRLGVVPANGHLVLDAARLLLERDQPGLALQVLEVVPPTPLAAALQLRALLAVGSLASLDVWLAQHEPSDPEVRLLAARANLLLGRPERAASLIEADVLLRPDAADLQLTAAEVELQRGHWARAAEAFARIPRGSSAGKAAQLGLSRSLGALGLGPLAEELAQ